MAQLMFPVCRSPRRTALWWNYHPPRLRFQENIEIPIAQVMTRENLVTAQGTVTLEEAEKILMEKKVEKLLLVDEK